MKLTEQQKDAVTHVGNSLVVACPGSGKTRTIIAKLLDSIDEIRGGTRQVACITYTNAATNEIENRVRMYGATGDEEYCDISTIHAFCQNNILRYFYWRLDNYKDGYQILPPDSDLYIQIVRDVVNDHDLSAYALMSFELLNRKPTGEPITSGDITHEAAIDYWSRLQAHGYIDFCNIVYYSYKLLERHRSIAKALAAKFPYILVDEFQDTSSLQASILGLIADNGSSTFFLVGDPEQSIYSFAGAQPEKMGDFSGEVGAVEFPLSGNYRSSTPVIVCAESLITRDPPMFAAGKAAAYTEAPTYVHADSDFSAITEHFLPALDEIGISLGDAAILAPNYYKLLPVGKSLREYGVPIIGPGARPYKRSHLFTRLAEIVCAYLVEKNPELVRGVEKELFNIIANITGKANYDIFSFQGRRVIFMIIQAGEEQLHKHEGAITWLREASAQIGSILCDEGYVSSESIKLITDSAEDIIRDMEGNRIDTANLRLEDLGMYANPKENLKLLTIHKGKGCEYEAVALIGLHDGVIPFHNQYNPLTPDRESEARRLFYVAITRAKRLLMLFSSQEEYRVRSRYLDEVGF